MRAAGLLAAIAATGCSFALVRPSPDAAGGCSSVVPVLDLGAAAGVAAVSTLAAGIANSTNGYNGCDQNPSQCHPASSALPGYFAAGAFVASAIYGFWAADACERVR
jgi:hypothetical protein